MGCARGAAALLLALPAALLFAGTAAAARAALTRTAAPPIIDPVAKWYIAEDTLPPELLADISFPDINIGDVLGVYHEAADKTPYWATHWWGGACV